MTKREQAAVATPTRDTVTWRVCDHSSQDTGVLAEAEIVRLAETYDLQPDALRKISQLMRWVLRPDLSVILKPTTIRNVASDKRNAGQKKVKRANDLIRMALSKLKEASIQLENVQFRDPYAHVGRPNPLNARLEDLGAVIVCLEEFGVFLATMERAEVAVVTGAPDGRKVMDIRRNILCTSLFNLWLDHDRPLTFTSDPVTSERTGKLFDFINDVVLCLTEPPQKLDGATLRKELQAFKGGA